MSREFEIKERGSIGEKYVCDYLTQRGYVIVTNNYHSLYGEIDIVARKENVLAFVEVKTRTNSSMTGGFESITKYKIRKIIRTVGDYLMNNNSLCQPRIDCAQVIVDRTDNSLIDISYIENAVEQEGLYAPF